MGAGAVMAGLTGCHDRAPPEAEVDLDAIRSSQGIESKNAKGRRTIDQDHIESYGFNHRLKRATHLLQMRVCAG